MIREAAETGSITAERPWKAEEIVVHTAEGHHPRYVRLLASWDANTLRASSSEGPKRADGW